MKEWISIVGAYLKGNRINLIVILASYGIFLLVFSLYTLPFEAVGYATLLTTVFLIIIGIVHLISFYQKHIILTKLRNSIAMTDVRFPLARDLIERDYQELVQILDQKRTEMMNEKEKAFAEMVDYYTTWAHQIKTPIAAMRLLLQAEPTDANQELLDQLSKVEQYVEMALQYLRMENMSADLLFKRYPLDDLVKQAVRKTSKSFIRKKIKLNYEQVNRPVLTDEKWLVFVIEQILSNSLKYTPEGGEISIYVEDSPLTLVIEDTGIGIEEEDLPRVFEKGFTGYNGRLDKKSTGIGLYLCKRTLDKLNHTIRIESAVGRGTKVKIGLDHPDILAE
ncbi:MAG: Two-component system histidine kinase [Candidatus Carbobacillus altaicus]|uniref:histidine kinase n=1 Tax=Candidatus Carbonibacillus altaicus TaxID=2163959 RepID=A0A2R6Y2F4_9BACL|nr:MAG: Two-component system histidine kinase [Candidatus Carbobacillus altaicus]